MVHLQVADRTPQSIAPALSLKKNGEATTKTRQVDAPSPENWAAPSEDNPASLEQMTDSAPSDDTSIFPILPSSTHRYFQPAELTEKPEVLQDIPLDKLASLPDIAPKPAVVQLLINEYGEVEKIVFDESFLSEQAKRFIIESFASAKFRPGKIGELAVKSALSVEVTLESVGIPVVVSTVH